MFSCVFNIPWVKYTRLPLLNWLMPSWATRSMWFLFFSILLIHLDRELLKSGFWESDLGHGFSIQISKSDWKNIEVKLSSIYKPVYHLFTIMQNQIYTFMEIVKLNNHDWDKANFILSYYLEKGFFRKEIRGPEDIIYHVVERPNDFELVYDVKFNSSQSYSEQPSNRRKRIER